MGLYRNQKSSSSFTSSLISSFSSGMFVLVILICLTSSTWCYNSDVDEEVDLNTNTNGLGFLGNGRNPTLNWGYTNRERERDRDGQGKGKGRSSSTTSLPLPSSSSSSSSSKVQSKASKYGMRARPPGALGTPGVAGEDLSMSMSNGLGEPSCEELRAMWRYHKRQSRAELTNQIPAFEPVLWELPMGMSASHGHGHGPLTSRSFRSGGPNPGVGGRVGGVGVGGLKHFRNRQRSKSSRYGGYGGGYPPYGTLSYFGSSPRQLRPMEELMLQQPPRPLPAVTLTEPKVQYSPPEPQPNDPPTTPTSLQQLQRMYVEERQRNGELPPSGSGKGTEDFGTVVLSPPQGQDGRIANKPKALMTPFEKIRFGHADFDGILNSKRGLFYYPIRASRVRDPPSQQPPQTTTTTTTTPRPSLPQAPIPSVFSFWRRQLLPQDPPVSLMMDTIESAPVPFVSSLPSCTMVSSLQCSINSQCTCQGHGLYRCHQGYCQFMPLVQTVEDEDPSRGSWHSGPILDETDLGVWEQEQDQQQQQQTDGVPTIDEQEENDENVSDSRGDNDE